MSWRKPAGDYEMVSPRALRQGDTIISRIGGGFRGDWHLRYYLVKPATPNKEDAT